MPSSFTQRTCSPKASWASSQQILLEQPDSQGGWLQERNPVLLWLPSPRFHCHNFTVQSMSKRRKLMHLLTNQERERRCVAGSHLEDSTTVISLAYRLGSPGDLYQTQKHPVHTKPINSQCRRGWWNTRILLFYKFLCDFNMHTSLDTHPNYNL